MEKLTTLGFIGGLLFSASTFALFDFEHEGTINNNSGSVKGSVDDTLFYSIGGGSIVSPAANGGRMQRLSMGGGWSSNLTCGNFDLNTTVNNQLNGITGGFKNLMSDVISGATGAVASLPAMVIQRANPGLYEILSNGVLQGSVAFDKSMLNCQSMSDVLADIGTTDKWTQAAIGEEFKKIVSYQTDGVAATQQQQKSTGKEGVKWIAGEQRGGVAQQAIKPTYDLAKAGYNVINELPANSSQSVDEARCNNSLCKRYPDSEKAAEAVVKILGDNSIRTCVVPEECQADSKEEDVPGSSISGTGFYSMLEETTAENLTLLQQFINGQLTPNDEHLEKLKTGNLPVSRNVIQSLKEDSNNATLIQRLSSELAMSDVMSVAFAMRRMLIVGKSEPYAVNNKLAQTEIDRRLAFLDREIQAMKNEMEIRKALSNNSLLTIVNRQQERKVDHRLQQTVNNDDMAFAQLSEEQLNE